MNRNDKIGTHAIELHFSTFDIKLNFEHISLSFSLHVKNDSEIKFVCTKTGLLTSHEQYNLNTWTQAKFPFHLIPATFFSRYIRYTAGGGRGSLTKNKP